MNESKIISSRKITEEEYNIIINLLKKYKLNDSNFKNNCKTLTLNKITYDDFIYNGYNPVKNTIIYNEKSNIIIELLHVASSTKNEYQGICIKPNSYYLETLGYGLNEGIADMFLELCNKEEGEFPFEKICAKVLKHVYKVKLFDFYFNNDDGGFRHFFKNNISNFLINLDDYSLAMIRAKKLFHKKGKVGETIKASIIVLMTVTINELLKIIDDKDEKNKQYLLNQLKSKTMKPVYDIIGEYNYDDYHK